MIARQMVQLDGELPEFALRRVRRFYSERYFASWGGKSIFSGRTPSVGSIVLQSNDYLSIGSDYRLLDAMSCACMRSQSYGYMSGVFLKDDDPLRELEHRLASFLGYEESLLTQSGYAANVGLLQAIVEPGTPIYLDTLAHASLWDGVISARGVPVRFAHNDMASLQAKVTEYGPGVIAVDSVYSTNGSLCDLVACADVCSRNQCVLVVDESHSLGTHGVHGEGIVASMALTGRVHFVTASLAKAYACRAGLIACHPGLKLFIMMSSRPAIFSSALLPVDAAGIRAAHELIVESDERRTRLRSISRYVREELGRLGYPVGNGSEQIIALEVGDERAVMEVRDQLESDDIFGSIFCPPATGIRRCLLRLSLSSGLSDAEIARLVDVFRQRRGRLRPSHWVASRLPAE